MRSGRTIRSELIADRENRRGSKRRIYETAFGVYRPLSEDSKQKVQGVLDKAKTKVDEKFAELGGLNQYTELIIPPDHGVTYVRRDNVLKALKTSALRNFSLARVKTDVENYNYRRQKTPTVPIDNLDWFGAGRLKLVAKFATAGSEVEALADDSEQIGTFLEEAGGEGLDVYEPDHITLCRFKRSRRGHELDPAQKEEVAKIVQNELMVAKIGALTLEEVVVTSAGYRQPPLELVPASA